MPKLSALLSHPLSSSFALLLLLALGLSVACGSGDQSSDGKATKASPAPADTNRIRGIDLSQAAELQTAMRQMGAGTLAMRDTLYLDVTGDKKEEAFVPIASGGTLGNVAYLGFSLKDDKPFIILTRTLDRANAGGLRMVAEKGKLVELAGEYGPQDPNCCPSVLRKTYFRWDGSRLQVEKEDKVPNPAGQKKD